MNDNADIKQRLGKVEARLLVVETGNAAIQERLKHIPTTHDMWRAVVLTGLAVLAGGWALLTFVGPGLLETAVKSVLADLPK